MTSPLRPNDWRPDAYARHAGFVPALAVDLIAMAGPLAGARVLDLGCGDGVLTSAIQAAGATVVGVDASPAMVAAARARGIDARQMAAEALSFDREFDAVLSNAMLHWTSDIEAVVAGVARALRPGGRFVGEFGGAGNIKHIVTAARDVLAAHGRRLADPWYFPSDDEFRAVLDAQGFVVDTIGLIPRPTPLPTDMIGWLETFGGPLVVDVLPDERAALIAAMAGRLAATNEPAPGAWMADYVRLRFAAHHPAAVQT
jgi:SAM-dependent methyltransferase